MASSAYQSAGDITHAEPKVAAPARMEQTAHRRAADGGVIAVRNGAEFGVDQWLDHFDDPPEVADSLADAAHRIVEG
ncbi:MAG TPA: hypothetical protein PLL69_01165 [Gemmatimonadales bacterium]|nr:hypothetical protein [Gemmatimonadales bacterium]